MPNCRSSRPNCWQSCKPWSHLIFATQGKAFTKRARCYALIAFSGEMELRGQQAIDQSHTFDEDPKCWLSWVSKVKNKRGRKKGNSPPNWPVECGGWWTWPSLLSLSLSLSLSFLKLRKKEWKFFSFPCIWAEAWGECVAGPINVWQSKARDSNERWAVISF